MSSKKPIRITKYNDGQLYTLMYRAEHEKDAYVCHIKGDFCGTLDDFFREISSGMRFPRYFGWNWDAFDECITDLEWLKFSSILIVIDNLEMLFLNEHAPNILIKLLKKHLNIAVEYWKSHDIPVFVCLNHIVNTG